MRCFISFLIFWCVFFNTNAQNIDCQKQHCIAVVDAGSTGSRLHIYAYDLDENNNPTRISERWSQKIKPGFSSLNPNQEVINAYLTVLFAGSPEKNLPVYFYGTGGMRLLPNSKQQLYYQALTNWFSNQNQWLLKNAKTISGREEGAFGWLAVNYKQGAFSSPDKPLLSVMDMGGASVQLTFPVENTDEIDPEDLFSIDVQGRHLVLYTHSFLRLGQMVFLEQFTNIESCFSMGYELPNGSLGKGDTQTCKQAVSKIINTIHEVRHTVKPAMDRKASNRWFALGGVASLAENKPLAFENQQFTNQELLERADNEVCHRPWLDLLTENPNNPYLYGACFFSSYYYSLMVDGYGIKKEEPINYIPQADNIDWSLGVVLHQH